MLAETGIKEKSSELKRRAVCLFLSLLFHLGLALFLFHSPLTVGVYLGGRFDVRQVMIVPREKLLLPEDLENVLFVEAGRDAAGFPRPSRSVPALPEESEPGRSESERTWETGRQSPYPFEREYSPGVTGREIFPSGLVSGFGLDLPLSYQSTLPPGYRLTLSRRAELGENIPQIGRLPLREPSPLQSYPSGFSAAGLSGRNISMARSGAGRDGHRASISVRVREYDLAHWAEEVVHKILRNWVVRAQEKAGTKTVVGVSVVVRRSGEVSSAEIVYPSFVKSRDAAALKAVEASVPFPMLPDDFPAETLEIFFEFHYDD